MGRTLARNKTAGNRPRSAVRSTRGARGKPKVKSKSVQPRKVSSPRRILNKAKHKIPMKTEKKAVKRFRSPVSNEVRSVESVARKPVVASRISSAPEAPSRLLRDSKTTAAALNLLEKGIKLIYQKEFRKARGELRSLIETYPGEAEIVARSRSYIQICDREEAAHRKPTITHDQLYTLGVMEHNRGNYDAAVSYFHQSLEKHPNADYIFYSIAASLALKGSVREAIEKLRMAIKLSEDNRIYAKNDADFYSLQSQKEFADLVGVSPASSHESQK